MNMGLVDLRELHANEKNADFRGKSAFCFVNGDKIIKVYANKNDGDYYLLDKNKICDLSVFKADTIVFPLRYLYENGKIAGEILNYIPDVAIDKSFNNSIDINLLISNYELVLNDLQLYSNIEMIDLCYVNILYSNANGFHIIDTTEWQIGSNTAKINYHQFSCSLIEVLIKYLEIGKLFKKHYSDEYKENEILIDSINKYGKTGDRFKNVLLQIKDGKGLFLELLFAYMDMYRIYCGNELKTLEEMKEFTKVLKKG